MAHSSMGHRYCSAIPALDKFLCSGVTPTVSLCCRSSFVVHPAWITEPLIHQRCRWMSHCLPSPGLVWERPSTLERSVGLDSNVPVLARGDQDGFYYLGTVKEESESERGMFLVEFAKPLVSHGRHPVSVQKTAKDDILEYVNGMKHSLLPGDKVLAPWEPDVARYGPGTVLSGIETRDPLRASEDEEIMVKFWNGKKVKLPRGVALWIPPSLCERIVEMIHMPFTSRVKSRESPDNNSCIFSCSLKPALTPICSVRSLAKHYLLCSPCCSRFHWYWDGICCSLACIRCICCCHPHVDAWWPLPPRSLVFQRETEEAESSSEPSPCLLELEGPKQEEPAAVVASSPSSDSECDLEPFPTKSTVVDSADSTDSRRPEKPGLKDSTRPVWKYWKRSHHMFHPNNSGAGSCSSTCTKGKLKPKAISIVDMSRVAPTNRNAMFETIEQSPRGQLTMKETLRDQYFKPLAGTRPPRDLFSILQEGFAASGKQRWKRARKKTESDDKHKATCTGDNKVDDTDHVRRGQTEKGSEERDMINANSINVQLVKFRS